VNKIGLARLLAAARGVYGEAVANAIREGLKALAAGQGPDKLYAACESLPTHTEPAPDPRGWDDRGPVSGDADWSDVAAAWDAGTLTDEQFNECLRRAGSTH
jgi:hypothetical protein